MKLILSLTTLCLWATTVSAQDSCYVERARTPRSGNSNYAVTFLKEVELKQNKSGNYSQRFAAGRNFGCIIFSVSPKLSGTYKAVGGKHLKARSSEESCKEKEDFAFMQFIDTKTKRRVFRIQCERAAYEDQKSRKFVPGSRDVQTLLSKVVRVSK